MDWVEGRWRGAMRLCSLWMHKSQRTLLTNPYPANPGPPRKPWAPEQNVSRPLHQERNHQQRDDVRHLDHRVDRGAGRVLVGIADRVTGDRGGVGLRALATVLSVLDQLLRVVPGAAPRGHRDRGEEADHDHADQEAAERLGR